MEQATIILAVISVALLSLLVFALIRLRSANRSKEQTSLAEQNIRQNVPCGLLTVNRDTGVISQANPASARLLGLKIEDLEGKAVYELLANPQRDETESEVPRSLPSGQTKFSCPDGSTAHIFVGEVGEDKEDQDSVSGGETTTLMLSGESEQVEAEATLADLEDRYRAVTSTSPAFVYTTDLSTGASSHDGDLLNAVPGDPELPVDPEDEDRVAEFRESFRESFRRAALEDEEPNPEADASVTEDPGAWQTIEYRLAPENGRRIHLREEARFVAGEDGRNSFVRGIILDVTDLKSTERKLEEVLGMKRAMTRSSVAGIAVRSRGRLFEVNASGAGILGSAPERMTGRAYLDFIHSDSERAARAGMRRTDRGDEEMRSRMLWRRDNGREVEVEVFATPIRYAGDENAALLFFEDITLREREKRTEILKVEDLDRRNARLEQFVHAISRGLAADLAELEAATNAADNSETRTNEIRSASEKIGRTVEELASLTSVPDSTEAGEEVDLSEVSRSVSNRLQKRNTQGYKTTKERSVEVIVAGGLIVRGDRKTLTQAMTNLVENAWRAAGSSPRPRIVVGRVERAGEAVFFVRDNGPGFDMAHAGSLFDPLRGDPESGYGEGLPAASRIIERHGGHIWAEGEPGGGATLYFTL